MRRVRALTVGVALVVAACGSDGDEGGGTTPPASDAPVATEVPEPEPESTDAPLTTDATEPEPTDPPPTDPPPTDPPETTTTTEPPVIANAVGLVPLPGAQLDFTGQTVPTQSLVWSLYSASGGIIIENVGGPLPPGCHGVSFFDPETFDLLQVDGTNAEAYATRGAGGCDGLRQDMGEGVVDGPATVINTDEVILFDFGGLPPQPFDVSTQVVAPDGSDGVFRSAPAESLLVENDLDAGDFTHVIGADVLFEVVDGELNPLTEPPPASGDCTGVPLCVSDRFGIEVSTATGDSGRVLAAGERSALIAFADGDEWQALVRVVNGCNINEHFWVFAASATAVEFTVTVTDTSDGDSRDYLGMTPLAPLLDTEAFATCP